MKKLDYKKEYQDLYLPTTKPSIIDVDKICYVVVEGKGNPNTSKAYKESIELLYGLSYTIKMDRKQENYFEYVVPPLEGMWWCKDASFDGLTITSKDQLCWKSMIRLPEFVTETIFMQARQKLSLKKPHLKIEKLKYQEIKEGLCVQIMHIGPYDLEKESIVKMDQFIKENHFESDFSLSRLHHEIYLSDPRRTKMENLKTVIRHPIKKES